jgi:hypothetical protein
MSRKVERPTNIEIIDAFRANGLRLPLQFFWRKPFLKFGQLLKRAAKRE